MRLLTYFLITTVSLFLLISCDDGGNDNIYGETPDYVYEEPDTTNDNYQTRPDNNDNSVIVQDEDGETGDSDSDAETPDETIDPTEGMVLIPAGKAWVGCNENQENDCSSAELPYHEVITKDFYIDKYEVTVKDFAKCVSDGACGEEGTAYETVSGNPFCNMNNSKLDHPMNCVSFFGANAYCEWAGKRLPAEGEWEKAARGGCEIHGEENCENDSYVYTWGNEGEPDCGKVNMANDGSDWGCGTDSTATGGNYAASDSPYLCSDMLGNLYEWVADSWSDDHAGAPTDGSSRGTPDSDGTIKGGSFMQYDTSQFRVSFRAKQLTTEMLYSRGFRCAMDATE
jgi:formylglycine-generating enzyme required for sulfatase activity